MVAKVAAGLFSSLGAGTLSLKQKGTKLNGVRQVSKSILTNKTAKEDSVPRQRSVALLKRSASLTLTVMFFKMCKLSLKPINTTVFHLEF